MRLTVWVADWQHECCGDAFGIGTTVRWTLGEPDEAMEMLFDPDLSVHVDREEDRHYVLTDLDTPDTVGTVTSIRSVRVHYARDPADERVRFPALPS